jgi:hypothetical protein
MTTPGGFSPQSRITDARQRWLFRMVHSNRPLQEKMTLFWHNHFATGYTKINGLIGAAEATRYMATKASEDPARVRGQIEMLRDLALANFEDILVNIAKDTAMLFWLDGRTNTRAQPQENFGREIMELFTMGVGHYTEVDVRGRASSPDGTCATGRRGRRVATLRVRVFRKPARDRREDIQLSHLRRRPHHSGATSRERDARRVGLHRGVGSNPRRRGISRPSCIALCPRPATSARRSSTGSRPCPPGARRDEAGHSGSAVVAGALSPASYFARYSRPVEFVVRAVKDGVDGVFLGDTLAPLGNMGQTL